MKQFIFIVVTDRRTHGWTCSCCVAQAQYPLCVGVVFVAVASGLERGCDPVVHACNKARHPLVVVLRNCTSNQHRLILGAFGVQSKGNVCFMSTLALGCDHTQRIYAFKAQTG